MRGQDQSSSSLLGYLNFEGRIRAKQSPRLSGEMLGLSPGVTHGTKGWRNPFTRRRGTTS
jgi:hypothetical protein